MTDNNLKKLYLKAVDYITHERNNDKLQKVKEYVEYRMKANEEYRESVERLNEQER